MLGCVRVCGSDRGSDASSREDLVTVLVDLPEDAVVLVIASAVVTIHVVGLGARRMHLLSSIIATNDKARLMQERSTLYCMSKLAG